MSCTYGWTSIAITSSYSWLTSRPLDNKHFMWTDNKINLKNYYFLDSQSMKNLQLSPPVAKQDQEGAYIIIRVRAKIKFYYKLLL